MDLNNQKPNELKFEKPEIILNSTINKITTKVEPSIPNKKPNIPKISSKKRCSYIGCNKKLKLTDLECDCQNRYCITHRLPHVHKCSYLLTKQNIHKQKIVDNKCVSEKVIKI